MKTMLSKNLKIAFPLLLAGAFGAGVVGPASAEYGAAGQQMDRSQTDRGQMDRSQTDRNQVDRNQVDRNQMDRNQVDRDQIGRDQIGRNQIGRGQMGRKVLIENNSEAAERSRALRQARGTVIQTKQVKVQNGGDVLVAMLATNKGDRRLLVDLGPNDQKLNIDKGEKMSVEGVVTRIGDRQVLVANRIKADGQLVKIDRESQIRQAERAHEGSRSGFRRDRTPGSDNN
jgi:hypothetical protein